MTYSYRYLIIIFSMLTALPAIAQDLTPPWQVYLYELATNEDDTGTLDEEAFGTLAQLEAQPINLNTATREELAQLPFLNQRQVEDICEYLYRHTPLLTFAELQAVPSIDRRRLQLLRCFTFIGEPATKDASLGDWLRQGRSQLLVTLRTPLYDRKGDLNGYQGYKYRHSIRYDFTATRHLRMAFCGAQDSGEPFFDHPNSMGYDHYAYYLQLNDIGSLQTFIAGHFNVDWGLGLTVNTSLSLGKLSLLPGTGRQAHTFRPSASRYAANYFQGVATTIRLSPTIKLSAFASLRPHDATLNADNASVATIIKTAYHRTPTEISKKNNLQSYANGVSLQVDKGRFHVATSAVYTHFSRPLHPNTLTLYRQYYPQGNDFANMSISYGYTSRTVSVSGETATDRNGAMATVNTLGLNWPYRLSIVMLQRYYSRRYTSLWGNAFSEGGHPQNESGIYLGMEYKPIGTLRLTAYADYAHFPHARYRVSRASDAFDAQVTGAYEPGNWTLSMRYRLRVRYRDADKKKAITRHTGHWARLAASHNAPRWGATLQADMALARYQQHDTGYMLSARGQWKPAKGLLVSMATAYFHTDSYDCRLYGYEPAPLQSFAVTAYNGHGLRYTIQARADIGQSWMVIAKAGTTHYFDRDHIGTGLQTIAASSMTDIDIQLRWKF